MKAKRNRLLFWICAIALLSVCFCFFSDAIGFAIQRLTMAVPTTGDRSLVGTWTGHWTFLSEIEPRNRSTTFRSDGTGESSDDSINFRPFRWGTEGGVLYLQAVHVDYLYRGFHAYTVEGSGTLRFTKVKDFDHLCAVMHRK